jgi:hypothetical protein
MDSQPTFDRSLILPILIGGFSVVGIVFVLLIGRSLNSPAEVPMIPSMTPFQYLFLGTEPGALTSVVEGSEIPPIEEPIEVTPTVLSLPTSLATSSNVTSTPIAVILRTSTSTPSGLATSTSTLSSPVAANTVDDTDPRLDYSGSWVSQTSVSGAYQGTLHISNTVGSSVMFSFTGQEIRLFYQGGQSLGAIIITIDNVGEPPISQSQNQTGISEWVFDDLTAGTHSIVITHSSGGSVNIDSLVVPTPTATPTRTPTPTLTPTQ